MVDFSTLCGAAVVVALAYYLVVFVVGDADNATYLGRENAEYYRDKVIWVTGASSGIGMQFCRHVSALHVGAKFIIRYARRCFVSVVRRGNARVAVASARTESKLRELAADLKKVDGTSVAVVACDLALLDQLPRVHDEAKKAFGRIDILVNNAGLSIRALAHESTMQRAFAATRFDCQFSAYVTWLDVSRTRSDERRLLFVHPVGQVSWCTLVNWLLSTLCELRPRCLRHRLVVPGMVERNWGHIVNVASLAGIVVWAIAALAAVMCACVCAVLSPFCLLSVPCWLVAAPIKGDAVAFIVFRRQIRSARLLQLHASRTLRERLQYFCMFRRRKRTKLAHLLFRSLIVCLQVTNVCPGAVRTSISLNRRLADGSKAG